MANPAVKSIFIPPAKFSVPTDAGVVHGVCFLGRVGLAYANPAYAMTALRHAMTDAGSTEYPVSYVGVDP